MSRRKKTCFVRLLGLSWCYYYLAAPTKFLFKSCLLLPGRQLDKIKTEAQEKGDLGLVAESSRGNQRMMFAPANLTAMGVFNKLKEIGNMSGNSVSTVMNQSRCIQAGV